MLEFIVNGEKIKFSGDSKISLLNYLRLFRGDTTPKDGCSQGSCGACTVCVDGKATLSCVTPLSKIAGKEVITAEGLPEDFKQAFIRAFVEKGGIQCGFCTPGIVMSAYCLLKDNINPSIDDIKAAINRNICRCTGYKKIIDAVLFTAEILRGEAPPIPKEDGKIGSRTSKYETAMAVIGKRPYVFDMTFESMKFGALKFSEYPKARVLNIDASEALKVKGVVRIITAKDLPTKNKVGLVRLDWPFMIKEGDVTNYIGDVIAGVVADSEETARFAASLIKVDYEVLTPVCSMEDAILPNAPIVHDGDENNVLSVSSLKIGDPENAIKNAAYVTKGVWTTQRIEHAFLETECAVALPTDEGKLTVYSQGQGVYVDRKQISLITGLEENNINVIQVQNGGAFGGKEDLTVQGHAAVYSMLCQCPVRVRLSREESMLMHPKRHPMKLEYTLACDKNGKLTALKANILGDTGAYASVGMKVMERAAGHSSGAYEVPNLDIEAKAIYTNNVPCGAMRGFGVNQSNFAMESCVDDLCHQGGFDRWQFRYDNALDVGSMITSGQILEQGVGLKKTLLAVKDDFKNAKFAGIACGVKNTGVGNGGIDESLVKIIVKAEDKIELYHGWTEMGQGVHTVALQVFCEETGLSPEIVTVKNETCSEASTGMTTSSRGTSLLGNAMLDACQKFNQDLNKYGLKNLVGKEYQGHWICDFTNNSFKGTLPEKPFAHYSYSYATQCVILDDEGRIKKVIAAHDSGRIINKTLYEGQVEGAVHMGLGYALTEDCEWKDGYPVHTKFGKIGILRVKETPEVKVIPIEEIDQYGPYGAKGLGEIGLVPTASAVAGAFRVFDGKQRFNLPMGYIKK